MAFAKREDWNAYKRHRSCSMREKVLQLLGNRCANCGNNDSRVLQLDHKFGATEKQGEYLRSGTALYEALACGRKKLLDFQLLCANCNVIKKHERQEVRGIRLKRFTVCGRAEQAPAP